jgi:hypothetical protein
MPRRRNDGLKNVDNELGRHHANGYTTHHNGFQQSERPTNGIRFNSIYLKQNLMMPLKFETTSKQLREESKINMGNSGQLCVNTKLRSFNACKDSFCVMKMFFQWKCIFE